MTLQMDPKNDTSDATNALATTTATNDGDGRQQTLSSSPDFFLMLMRRGRRTLD